MNFRDRLVVASINRPIMPWAGATPTALGSPIIMWSSGAQVSRIFMWTNDCLEPKGPIGSSSMQFPLMAHPCLCGFDRSSSETSPSIHDRVAPNYALGWNRDRLASHIRFECGGRSFRSLGPKSVERGAKVSIVGGCGPPQPSHLRRQKLAVSRPSVRFFVWALPNRAFCASGADAMVRIPARSPRKSIVRPSSSYLSSTYLSLLG